MELVLFLSLEDLPELGESQLHSPDFSLASETVATNDSQTKRAQSVQVSKDVMQMQRARA